MGKWFFIFVSLFVVLVSARAEEDERIAEINRQVEIETRNLEDISNNLEDLTKQLKDNRSALLELKKEEEKLTKELSQVNAERSAAEREMKNALSELSRVSSAMGKRARALYIYREGDVSGQILFPKARGEPDRDMAKYAFFMAKLKEHDASLLKELARVKEAKEKRQAELKGVIETQELYRSRITKQREIAKSRLDKQEALADDLRRDKDRREKTLAALKAQALRLETVVTSLTGGEEERERPSRPMAVMPRVTPFDGPGLFKLKGTLTFPVKGKILRKFGKYRTSGFKEMILNKGVQFSTEPQAEVRAIAEGKVMFQGTMPGYGTILIVDHGERYYCLYGLLSEVEVSRGDEVEKAEVIASTADPDEEGKNFYFEIRKNGESVNPQVYFPKRF